MFFTNLNKKNEVHLIIISRTLAEHAGCNSTESNSLLLLCLQRADEYVIASIMKNKFLTSETGTYVPNPFLPVMDCSNGEKTSILTKDPLDMIDNLEFNDVPLILGSNSGEGVTFVPKFLPANPAKFIKEHWNTNKTSQLLIGRYVKTKSKNQF